MRSQSANGTESKPAVRSLTVQNLLSFGEDPTTIDLRNLNILIGANGSGKSNLIEVLGLLQNAPKELGTAVNDGGPVDEWLWKGAAKPPTALIEAVIMPPANGRTKLRYRLKFTKAGFRFEITEEVLEDERASARGARTGAYYSFASGRAALNFKGKQREIRQEEINPRLSILSQRKDPEHYPEITSVGKLFGEFRLYRDWEFGTFAAVREPCDAGLPSDFLEEDGSNLGVVLDRLLDVPSAKRRILESLQIFYESTSDLRSKTEGGKVQIRLEEKHLQTTVPLNRMSDGTVRWLALLAILLNDKPQPLVVIEEPELGLHPDMIRELGKLLVDASTRTQLVLTTHSDRLIEVFTDRPESVIVCERHHGASAFRRLEARQLSSWLKQYTLGELWIKGQLGGTRW